MKDHVAVLFLTPSHNVAGQEPGPLRFYNREWKKEVIDRRVGKIIARNSRAAGLYNVTVKDVDGRYVLVRLAHEAAGG